MDDRIARIIRNISSLKDLAQFEANAEARNQLTDEIKDAIRERSGALGVALVAARTGLDLSNLSPAETKIVQAASEYVGVKTRKGTNANRTLNQLRDLGLIDAAEASVSKSKPTQGFLTLTDEDLGDLSYEQIVVDHPDEFSSRALWFSRRTLGLPNDSDKAPAKAVTPAQVRTETLLKWLRDRSETNGRRIPAFTNADSAAALGMADLYKYGRVFGNIQSRLDYACYKAGLPPLGLAADAPFEKAWDQQTRDWAFPIETMQAAAQSHIWTAEDFERIHRQTERLPGQAHISWKKDLVEHQAEVRAWAFGLDASNTSSPPAAEEDETETSRNPAWSRDELILALDLYLRLPGAMPRKDSSEVIELSSFLGKMGRARSAEKGDTYRNANGVYMKLNNFKRFDPRYTSDGKVGLSRGNKNEEVVWDEFSTDPAALKAEVARIRSSVDAIEKEQSSASATDGEYWVFVCNPKKWAIDRFLAQRVERDTWGVRPSDRARFAPGQLGIVRVGVDRRSAAKRNGKPPLEAGIYALCEVESEAYEATGAGDEFWTPGEEREAGWPTVKIRYLRTYAEAPLTIERLRAEAPDVSGLLLNGFQAASFPISADDFRKVTALLGEEVDDLPLQAEQAAADPDKLAEMEKKYLHACPEVKQRVSKTVERGPIGALVKKATSYKCQICDALGHNPLGFLKVNGQHYVEAHHVMPVSKKQIGTLSASNIMTLCANHHRQVHYGGVDVVVSGTAFELSLDGKLINIPRLNISTENPAQSEKVVAQPEMLAV